MIQVKINGFTYYYAGNKLFEDSLLTKQIDINKQLTTNEKMQLEVYLKYDGKPMYSF